MKDNTPIAADFKPGASKEDALAKLLVADHYMLVTITLADNNMLEYNVKSSSEFVRAHLIQVADTFDNAQLPFLNNTPRKNNDSDQEEA